MADDRLARLEAQVAALSAKLKPQAIRNALATTSDPRGYADWTRTIDDTGALVTPPRRAFQFPGATITDDPTLGDRGATVVTIASGGGGMSGVFSPDAATSDAERIKFTDSAVPAINHWVLDTATIGTTRYALLLAAEDTTAPADYSAIYMIQDATAGVGTLYGLANGSTSSDFHIGASRTGGAAAANLFGTTGAGGATVSVGADASNGPTAATLGATSTGAADVAHVDVVARSNGAGCDAELIATDDVVGDSTIVRVEATSTTGEVEIEALAATRKLLTDAYLSGWVQTEADTTTAAAVQRVERGPFTVTVTALAALGTQSTTINNARNGSDYVVMGGPNGAAGSELLQWSWTNSAVNDITINITNTDAVNALTATLRFYVISTS